MVIIEELYSALIEVGASDSKAKDAAGAVAAYENQLADVRADLKLLKWMVGLTLTGVGSLLLGAISYIFQHG